MDGVSIWYTPETATQPIRIDLGTLQSFACEPVREFVSAESGSGKRLERHLRSRLRVEATKRFSSRPLRAACEGLASHLETGGTCALALERSYAWAGFVTEGGRRGSTTFEIEVDQWSAYGQATLPEDEEIILQSDSPEQWRERHIIHAQSSRLRVDLKRPLVRSWLQAPGYAFARHWGFFPLMYASKEARNIPILSSDSETRWELRLVLDEDLAALRAITQSGGQVWGGVADAGLAPIEGTVDLIEQARSIAHGSGRTGRSLGWVV